MFSFSTPVLITHVWQLKKAVFLHRRLVRVILFVKVTKLGNISPIWLLLEAQYDFFKNKSPKKMATFWAAFGFSNLITFSL
jgi:hypothetical protein